MIWNPSVVLLVEDDRLDAELTLNAFREGGATCRVVHVSTGEDALDYIHARGGYADRATFPFPDLMLLDLRLPGIDGFDVLREVKSSPGLRRLPVVILTSSKEEGDRATGYDSGANSYLVKPVDYAGYLDVVARIRDYWFGLNVLPPAPGGEGQ